MQFVCQLAEKRYVTFLEQCVNLGLPRQVAELVRLWEGGSGRVGEVALSTWIRHLGGQSDA